MQTDTYIDDVFLEFSWCMDTYQISRTIFCDPILNLRWWATRHRFIDFAPLPPATAGQVTEDPRDVRREGGLLQWWRCSCPTWTWIASHRRSLTMFDNVRTLWWWVHHQKIEKPQGWLLKLDIAYYIGIFVPWLTICWVGSYLEIYDQLLYPALLTPGSLANIGPAAVFITLAHWSLSCFKFR